MILATVFALVTQPAVATHKTSPIVTPYRSQEKLWTRSVKSPKIEVGTFEPIELDLEIAATYDNPFDPSDISVTVRVEDSAGKGYTLPGYFSSDCERKLVDGKEVVTKVGKPGWKAKVSFKEAGTFQVSALVKDRTGSSLSDAVTIKAVPKNLPGFARISEKDHRYFETSDGKSFYPLGSNICWGGDAGTYNYDTWIPKYAENGCNIFRIWLGPDWSTFALERAGKTREGKGMGQFSLENLYRIDYVVNLARSRGMKIKFCIDSYNILRDRDAANFWEQTPHNIANGGILHTQSEFWDSAEMEELYLAKMRYLVARYSADPTVFAWEFWNECDLTRDFPIDKVKTWHQKMGRELRKQDPFQHLITTSFSDTMGYKDVDLLNEMDYVQTHNYNSPDVISQVAIQQSRKGSWNKPHYVAEIGADFEGPRAKDDPTGLQLHDPLWTSICMGSSAAAQPWWWDSYTEPNNLYGLFGAASRYLAGIDWPEEGFRQTQPQISWMTKPAIPVRKDLVIQNGPSDWVASQYNKPRTVHVDGNGASGQTPVSGLLHGTVNHPDWHNPITFRTDLPRSTEFSVIVEGVSGYGGGRLVIELDGSAFMTREFPDADGNTKTDTLSQYNGAYRVTIPAGKHVLTVRNTGADWVQASYRFKDALVRENPPLIGWATVGNETALSWVRVEDRSWRRVCVLKEEIPACPPTVVRIPGLASGVWQVELWDTWKGQVVRNTDVRVSLDGTLRIELPAVEKDFAIKAVRRKKSTGVE